MCAAVATGSRTRRRSKSRRVTSRSRKRTVSTAALPSPPSSLEFEEPTSYFDYIRTVLAGIVTNVLIIFIFLTLKSAIFVTDFVNLILSSVIFPVVSFYLLWISVHFIGSHMYINQCVGPYNLVGFLKSPFVAASPVCAALRYGINQGGNYIMLMWMNIGIATLAFSRALILKIINRNKSTDINEQNLEESNVEQKIETVTTTTMQEDSIINAETTCAPVDSDDTHVMSPCDS